MSTIQIDLTEAVRQNVLLAVPMVSLCKPRLRRTVFTVRL